MSVTLTTEQFAALIANVNLAPKKKTKSLVKDYVDAVDIEQFITHLEFLKVSKLMKLDLCDFICETIKMNIEPLEDNVIPFVCANSQKRIFYYKSNGEWKKSNEFIKLIFNKIWKQASKEVCEKFTKINHDNDDDDDDVIERNYESSTHYEKQQILRNLCYADKYSSEKLMDKILTKLGKVMKNNEFDIEK
jgi:hypothetical protein